VAEDPNDIVPDDVEKALNTLTLVAGGLVGIGSLLQLSIDVVEGNDIVKSLNSEFGVNQLEEAVVEMEKMKEVE